MFNNYPDYSYNIVQGNEILTSECMKADGKKLQKRLSNRQSASASRARKKILIQEMTAEVEILRDRVKILDLMPDLIAVINSLGAVSYISETCEHFLYTTSRDICNRSLFDIVTSDCHEALRGIIAEALSPNINQSCESIFHSTNSIKSNDNVSPRSSEHILTGTKKKLSHSSMTALQYEEPKKPFEDKSNSNGSSQINSTASINTKCSNQVPCDSSSGSSGNSKISSLSAWTSTSGISLEGSGSSSSGTSNSHIIKQELPTVNPGNKFPKHLSNYRQTKLSRQTSRSNTQHVGGKCRLCLRRRDNSDLWCEVRFSRFSPNNGANPEIVISFRPVVYDEGIGVNGTFSSMLSSLKILQKNMKKNIENRKKEKNDILSSAVKKRGSKTTETHSIEKQYWKGYQISSKLEESIVFQDSHDPRRNLSTGHEQKNYVTTDCGAEDPGGSSDDIRNAVKSLMLIHTGPSKKNELEKKYEKD